MGKLFSDEEITALMLDHVKKFPLATAFKPGGCQHRQGHKTIASARRCLNSINRIGNEVLNDIHEGAY